MLSVPRPVHRYVRNVASVPLVESEARQAKLVECALVHPRYQFRGINTLELSFNKMDELLMLLTVILIVLLLSDGPFAVEQGNFMIIF